MTELSDPRMKLENEQDLGRVQRVHRFSPEIHRNLSLLSKEKDNWHGPFAFLEDIIIIAGAIWLSTLSMYFYPITLILVGSRQRALATILHEASHYTLCRSRRLNKIIGMLAGWPILQSFYRYQNSHVQEHHIYLGDPNMDPDYRNYIEQGLFEGDHQNFVRNNMILAFLGLKSPRNLQNLLRDRLFASGSSAKSGPARVETALFCAFWATVIFGFWYAGLLLPLILFWFVPYLTTFQAVNWIIELAEHFPLVKLFNTELHMTRNRRGNAFENFLTGMHGENWHLVHHLRPGVPFWLLPKAHEIMLQDPTYAKANSLNGGLFTSGPEGEPSILKIMDAQLQMSHSELRKASA